MSKKCYLLWMMIAVFVIDLDARDVFVTWTNETDLSAHVSSKPYPLIIFLLETGKSKKFSFKIDDDQHFSDRIKAGPISGWDSQMQRIDLPAGSNPLHLKYRYCLGQDGHKALLVEVMLSDE